MILETNKFSYTSIIFLYETIKNIERSAPVLNSTRLRKAQIFLINSHEYISTSYEF